jgi:hypothetical protein
LVTGTVPVGAAKIKLGVKQGSNGADAVATKEPKLESTPDVGKTSARDAGSVSKIRFDHPGILLSKTEHS